MTETKDEAPAMQTRSGRAKQPLVVRHSGDDFERQVLDRLHALETQTPDTNNKRKLADRRSLAKFEPRTIAAIAAIVLSVAGYVIQDARNSSRQDAEIETAKARLSNLEHIAAINTESRIRTEVQLGELKEGQSEIKRLLEVHESETQGLFRNRRNTK